MPNPFLHADTIRFGQEEAIRMHALALADAAEKLRAADDEPVVLQTYTLQLVGPPNSILATWVAWEWENSIRETEENLTDLLPEGYEVEIKEWDA
jgi:hypothetical protein